ncbi:MAG TPA: two-component regulator propeller domain-containing protein [Opitutaceae bacterium]|nr:two-component regulator propeller domain-containing protein [Opitutaceae bacterium]
MPKAFRLLALLPLVKLVCATCCSAATFLADGYVIRVWQTEDGLPQNLVTSAIQTRDSYLWFGTHSGLTRFDGERFEVFDPSTTPGLENGLISCLFEAGDGTLWIGDDTGGISRYREGRFERFAFASAPRAERVYGIGSDEQGHLWAMRIDGSVDSLDTGTRLPSLIEGERPGVMSWSRSAGGAIWMSGNGRVAHLENGKLVRQSFPSPRLTNYAQTVGAAADGGVWVLCDTRVRKWNGSRWSEDRGGDPWTPMPMTCCLELRDGTLAVGTVHSGLYLIFKDGRTPVHLDHRSGIPQNWVRFLFEDREGSLWVGTGSAGLVSIRPTPFSSLASREQWQGCSVLSIGSGRSGDLWIGTDGAGLHRYSAGEWRHYGESEGLLNWHIPAVAETPGGEIWVGDNWWGAPYRLEQDRFVRPASVDPASNPAHALLPVPGTDDVLVGNSDGLRRLHGDTATWLVKTPPGIKGSVCAIAIDREGAIWGGYSQGGLARHKEGKTAFFGRKDGLDSESVQCLRADPDGTLWIGTADGGLSRFKDGRFVNLGIEQGLLSKFVAYILDDGLGYLWLSTHHGLQRVAKQELNRCADGDVRTVESQIYDQTDGLPTIDFTGGLQAAGCKTADGRLWFANSKGVLCVDPARITPNPITPPVVLGSFVVDGRANASIRGVATEQLAPDHRRLEFRYSGLSFVAPDKVRFKYRLIGIDRDWIDAGAKRTAFYSRLPAGNYQFRVIACNNDGLWNTEGATLVFTVAPFFWQTWWFVAICLLAAAAGIAWLARFFTRRRMQKRIEQVQRQHEIERERTRIAQDIHDDVGASLSRIAMLSQPGRNDLKDPARTATMLSGIYSTAREVIRSLDEIVWAVDPRHDTLDSLVDYMARYAQAYLATADLRCRLDLPVTVPAWPLTAETRHNLFLAFKETLNNAVKHATASEMRVAFRLLPDSFALEISDNGRGFATADRPPSPDRLCSGHGMANLHERLRRIGGRCEVSSSNEGTTVTLIVAVKGELASDANAVTHSSALSDEP